MSVVFDPATMNPASIILNDTTTSCIDSYINLFIILLLLIIIILIFIKKNCLFS